ncbi:Peptidase family M48 family protein [Klebsormidium nitens]|uniref:Peptidase family M48 family protein n=1 Tax=Klebsormidium nitens TaxID=105231 RepID=A0A1Y1I8J9_KLENI|nr:Peptidase family M48 family protein [Klebsormidium nitens]|eukprot:GAQ87304.1 Peptidase family M48 family protein [Klebsormidium nitens]
MGRGCFYGSGFDFDPRGSSPARTLQPTQRQARRITASASVLDEAPLNLNQSSGARTEQQPRIFKGLKAAEFQHPLDRQNTAILRAFPGIQEIAKMLFSPVAEQVLLLENIATSVRVGEHQLTRVYKLLTEAADILDMDAPDLYIRQNPTPNAYTLAIAGRKPFIVVHTSLVELLTPAELQAVLAHEMGHLKCDHGVWLTFANVLAMSAGSLPGLGRFIAANLEDKLMRWLRAAELTCDRAALLVAQDPKVVVSVLMKLAGGCPSLADDLNVDSFLNQARSYDEASNSPFGWYLRNAQTRQLSHPLPVLRAREIDEWSRGKQYQLLMGAVSTAAASVGGSPGRTTPVLR